MDQTRSSHGVQFNPSADCIRNCVRPAPSRMQSINIYGASCNARGFRTELRDSRDPTDSTGLAVPLSAGRPEIQFRRVARPKPTRQRQDRACRCGRARSRDRGHRRYDPCRQRTGRVPATTVRRTSGSVRGAPGNRRPYRERHHRRVVRRRSRLGADVCHLHESRDKTEQ